MYTLSVGEKNADVIAIFVSGKPYIQSNLYKEVAFGTKKKWPYKTGDLLKRFNSYEIFYDRTKKK